MEGRESHLIDSNTKSDSDPNRLVGNVVFFPSKCQPLVRNGNLILT